MFLLRFFAISFEHSRYENEKSNKSDQKITRNYYDVRNIPFADSLSTHIASNNMSDIDSSGGVSLINGDSGAFLGQGLGPGLGQGHGVRSSRIDDQLEARMEFAESSNSSNYNNNTNTNTNMSAENSFYDNRLSIISRLMAQEQEQGQLEGQGQGQGQGVVLSRAPNSGSGPNFGPFGGPNFGPYGGPNFGSKVTSDRWSALGTQFVPVTQGPLVPSASGVFNEIDSNILCDSCECGRADADDGNNIMVRGNTDYNSSDTAAAATASELFMKCYLETLSMGTDVYKDDVCTDIQVNKGTDESKSGCILRAAQSDIVSISQSVTDGGKVAAVDMSDISNLTVLNLIMNRDRDRDRDRDRQSSEEMKGTKVDDTECNHDVQKQAANSATVIKGKTYAEVVMSKKELIKEIEEERRRQEIEYTTSPRHSVNGKVLKESSPNATDVEVLKESSPTATDVKVDAKNSLVGKELKLGNVFPAIDNTEGNNEIAATSSTVSSDNVDVQRNRLNSLDCSSVDSSDDDSTDDEEKGDRNGSTDADTLAARRKSLKSNSVSITKLKLTSPGKPLIKQNNTILNKLNSMVHTDSYNNGGNSGTVNTLFSVLSLGSSVNSNNSSPRNSPQNAVNDNKTFNNENTSFNNNYNSHSKTTNENIKNNLSVGSSAGLTNNNNNNNNSNHNGYGNHSNGHHNGVNYQVNNTNYTVNNNNNNMKPNMNYNKSVTNYSNGSSSHSSHSSHLNQNGINGIQKNHSSSGSLQKLNHSHHSKNSVKRHGSLNSISNYGSNNFPNSQSPGKSKIKMNNISTHNNTNSNSSSSHVHYQSNNSMRDIASRHHSDSATYDQFEDDLLLHDDLYLQFTNKIQKFTEVKNIHSFLLVYLKFYCILSIFSCYISVVFIFIFASYIPPRHSLFSLISSIFDPFDFCLAPLLQFF